METLQISKVNALKAFKDADQKGKTLLTNLFGKEVLSAKITDRIKSFEDACAELNISFDEIMSQDESEDEWAYKMLKIISRALNEGWTPDWENESEQKFYPYFKMQSGFAFSNTTYDWTHTTTGVSSRLCFKTRELAEYAGKQFESTYKDFLTL